jgi:hypothetical protein
MPSRRWGQHQTLDQGTCFWLTCIDSARAFAARWPQGYVETRLEDFVARPEAEIARILRALGLEDRSTEMLAQFRDRVRFDSVRIAGKDRDLTTSAEVEAITGPTMVALGYC